MRNDMLVVDVGSTSNYDYGAKNGRRPGVRSELLILSSLAGGPGHGYAIMQEVAGPGTLYTAITRLVDNGWFEPEEASGRQRPYRLTDQGLDYLRGQLEKMRQLASFGLRRLRTV